MSAVPTLTLLAETSGSLGATRARKAKTAILAETLSRLPPAELEAAVTLLVGAVPGGPAGVGPAAVREVSGVAPSAAPSLSVSDVVGALAALRAISGAGAGARRRAALAALFAAATAPEQRFLAGVLVGELRQGALEGLLVEAVALASGIDAPRVRRAAMLAGDPAAVAHAALTAGAQALDAFRLAVLAPVQPMLASPAGGVDEALAALGRAAFERKLDGARVQIHKAEGEVRIFSRSLREVTGSVPEIATLAAAAPGRSMIVDGEVLALHGDGTPRPFQETMRRFGRRLDVERMRSELPLTLFAFDCLHLDGEDLIDLGTDHRHERLRSALGAGSLVPRLVTDSADAARAFLEEALAEGHEGVMAKALDAPYAAGSRGSAWLKIKQAHTLDLVVIAVEHGSGRRRGWLSNLHLAARDEGGGFVMLGKTFKGLTDEMLAWQTEHLRALATREEGHMVHVRPELVVEIAFNELQSSPRYPGGLALRFARVVRHRPDKSAREADTFATVRAIAEGGSPARTR